MFHTSWGLYSYQTVLFVMESDLKRELEFMCESDSPIKVDLSDIPHVAESEKTSSFFLFFIQSTQNGEGRGRGVWVGVGVSVQKAC